MENLKLGDVLERWGEHFVVTEIFKSDWGISLTLNYDRVVLNDELDKFKYLGGNLKKGQPIQDVNTLLENVGKMVYIIDEQKWGLLNWAKVNFDTVEFEVMFFENSYKNTVDFYFDEREMLKVDF